MIYGDNWSKATRLGGLRRFAVAITIFNILGHTLFGFEQSLAQPLMALATCYSMELLLETIDARINRRRPNFLGGVINLVDFLLSAHITGLAIAMLLYANDRLWPVVFASTVAMGSKSILRVRVGGSTKHFLNPSNFGISLTLLVFPWVGIAPPYHFTENLDGAGDWILPAIIIVSGSFLNARFTKKLPLIAAWLIGFAAQAGFRSLVCDTPLVAALMPATGVAFILYTFYMVTDPATSPSATRGQILFGVGVAFTYGALLFLHAVFGLFFALSIVCAVRGLWLYARAFTMSKTSVKVPAPPAQQVTSVVGEV